MTDYLVFRLYAPLASWGEAAVGEARPTATHPGRAAIIGILGAALGIKRDDDAGQNALNASVRIAVKQRSPGLLMRDYHTAQVPATRPQVQYRTRRDELNAPHKVINTVLSSRDYRCDGLWIVAVWLSEEATYSLATLEQSLKRPHFTLYLGRKACPVAAPLQPRCVSTERLRQALDSEFTEVAHDEEHIPRLSGELLYCWEGAANTLDGQAEGVESNDVWDDPLSRRRWQFSRRAEFRRRLPRADEEVR